MESIQTVKNDLNRSPDALANGIYPFPIHGDFRSWSCVDGRVGQEGFEIDTLEALLKTSNQ